MQIPAISPLTILIWLIFGAVTSFYAKRNGKNPYLWFLLGTLLGVVGIFFLFFMPKAKRKEATIQALTAPKELFWFYLDGENRQRGPFGFDVLKKAWLDGKLTPTTHVWNQTLDKWEPLIRFLPACFRNTGK